jgi:hypothetical protein
MSQVRKTCGKAPKNWRGLPLNWSNSPVILDSDFFFCDIHSLSISPATQAGLFFSCFALTLLAKSHKATEFWPKKRAQQ